MWCFFDESYPPEGGVTAVVACLMQSQTVRTLDRELFLIRQRHFGDAHARDLSRELKGSALLSRQSFRYLRRYGNSTNHSVVNAIFDACIRLRSYHPIHVFGAVVYGARDLLTADSGPRLVKPLTHILDRVSEAACRINRRDRVNLVFDEQIGTRADVAIRTRQFVSGVDLQNVSHYPLSAVSNTSPGIQLADIGAYILGRQAVGDPDFAYWMGRIRGLEWKSMVNGRRTRGIGLFEKADGVIRRIRTWRTDGLQ